MSIKKISKPLRFKSLLVVAVALVVVAAVGCFAVAKRYFVNHVLSLEGEKSVSLFVPTGSSFQDVVDLLNFRGWLADEQAFRTMAGLMNFSDASVKPGRYVLNSSLSARSLVALLRSGNQKPVKVTFNNIRTLDRLAGVASRNLEVDSATLLHAMLSDSILERLGFNKQTSLALFLPDTYDVWWNISPDDFMSRMKREYDAFWNDYRVRKADSIGLSPVQVSCLASIIDEETNKIDELPIIAQLYLNRLRLGMKLEACPTLKFAKGDFSIRRVLAEYKLIDSPYNTYMYHGLPPGPIRVPSKAAIDAVLNPSFNDFLFMCAKPDGSGRHAFAKTNAQHARNAALYHQQLNKLKIFN